MIIKLAESNLLDHSQTALWVSIYLSVELPDASVRYQSSGNTHQFVIECDSLSYELGLDDGALKTMDMEELIATLGLVVDRVLAGAGPLALSLRSNACGHLVHA